MAVELLVLATLVLIFEAFRRRDPVILATSISIVTYYTYRAVELASGSAQPTPAYLFRLEDRSTFERVDLLVVAWIVCILVLPFGVSTRPSATTFPRWSTVRLWPAVVLVVAMTTLLLLQHGGLAGLQRYSRLGNEGNGGTGIYLLLPSILMAAAMARIWRVSDDGRRLISWPSVFAILTASMSFLLLGSRLPIGASIVAMVVGALFRVRVTGRLTGRLIVALVIAAVVVPQLAVGLRELRDSSLSNGRVTRSASQPTFSQSIDANFYDAFALVVRDSGVTIGTLGPSLLVEQSVSIFPRALWQSKPDYPSVGKWLRRQYEPERINGWPTGAPGDWYLMLGYFGIPLGAALTVAVSRRLNRMASRHSAAPVELGVLWGLMVMSAGADSQILSRLTIWVIAPAVYLFLLSRPAAPPLAPIQSEATNQKVYT